MVSSNGLEREDGQTVGTRRGRDRVHGITLIPSLGRDLGFSLFIK